MFKTQDQTLTIYRVDKYIEQTVKGIYTCVHRETCSNDEDCSNETTETANLLATINITIFFPQCTCCQMSCTSPVNKKRQLYFHSLARPTFWIGADLFSVRVSVLHPSLADWKSNDTNFSCRNDLSGWANGVVLFMGLESSEIQWQFHGVK